jgi:hypothetical protein
MIVSAHQPVYLPGIIFFNKLALSDACMLLPHCQFVAHSWHQRNRIRNANQAQWLSVPVNANFGQSIADASFANDHWRRKHLASLRHVYGKRPFFDAYFPQLERLLSAEYSNLADLDIQLIRQLCEWLDVRTPLYDSRHHAFKGHKTELLIEVCNALGADRMVSNVGSAVYVDELLMSQHGITHHWQRFHHPSYTQGGVFIPDLSVVDLLFNVGPAAAELVLNAGYIDPTLEMQGEGSS